MLHRVSEPVVGIELLVVRQFSCFLPPKKSQNGRTYSRPSTVKSHFSIYMHSFRCRSNLIPKISTPTRSIALLRWITDLQIKLV